MTIDLDARTRSGGIEEEIRRLWDKSSPTKNDAPFPTIRHTLRGLHRGRCGQEERESKRKLPAALGIYTTGGKCRREKSRQTDQKSLPPVEYSDQK